MKILKENNNKINIFKDVPFAKMPAKASQILSKKDVDESLTLNEDIYTDIEVGTCFRIPNDPNRTVYEINKILLEVRDGNTASIAYFGSHGHQYHTIYSALESELKDALANGLLLICDELHKQDLRKW